MKTLFHPKWHSYNDKASELDEETRKVTEHIIKKWIDDGYSPRDIESVMMSTLSMTICVEHMKRNSMLLKKEREENGSSRALKPARQGTHGSGGPPKGQGGRQKPVWKKVKVKLPFCPQCGNELQRPSNADARSMFTWQCWKCNYVD